MMQAVLYRSGSGEKCQIGNTSGMENRIQFWRKKRGLTQEQLAERLDCSQPQVRRLEHGDRSLTLEWMRRAASALNVTVADLLVDADNPYRLSGEEETELVSILRRMNDRFRARLLSRAMLLWRVQEGLITEAEADAISGVSEPSRQERDTSSRTSRTRPPSSQTVE